MYSIAFFISPHGYGHAARASAVMAAMHELDPSIRFEIFTTVPQWFFQQSLSGLFGYHSLLTDIGMAQESPLREDLTETFRKLNDFLPYDCFLIERLAREMSTIKCRLILCDISPMGIVVAQNACIPSVLIENFTWDWVYEYYAGHDLPAKQHIEYLRNIFKSVNYHIQAEPVCLYGNADFTTQPISRKVRESARQIRQKLGVPDDAKVVIITMGGIPEKRMSLEQLKHYDNIYFVVPGSRHAMQRVNNLILLPHHSDIYHPDLIHACDAVIGKLGYSTLAEIYYAGLPYGYIPRPSFRESEILEAFVKERMHGYAISESQYQEGSWTTFLPEILALPGMTRTEPNGADHAAKFIYEILNNGGE